MMNPPMRLSSARPTMGSASNTRKVPKRNMAATSRSLRTLRLVWCIRVSEAGLRALAAVPLLELDVYGAKPAPHRVRLVLGMTDPDPLLDRRRNDFAGVADAVEVRVLLQRVGRLRAIVGQVVAAVPVDVAQAEVAARSAAADLRQYPPHECLPNPGPLPLTRRVHAQVRPGDPPVPPTWRRSVLSMR